MYKIVIISASIREKRRSHRVALFFKKYLEENNLAIAEILDLEEKRYPFFHERLRFMATPTQHLINLSDRIKAAEGIIIVTPEYNGGYPASLKNVIDVLYDEWYHKPVAISTVSDGNFGGSQVITSLQFVLWKMHAMTVPAMFPVPNVNKSFDEEGNPADLSSLESRLTYFINELMWCVEAVKGADKVKK